MDSWITQKAPTYPMNVPQTLNWLVYEGNPFIFRGIWGIFEGSVGIFLDG